MPIIKLADHVVNQIAAGEVVERPASVVKELIENSIDAGASKIIVKIVAGGKGLISVIDNGSGIAKSDLDLVFERHATSKIENLTDLEKVQSLGFRGEALASIASVAKVTLRTKTEVADYGYEVVKSGLEIGEPKPISLGTGTTIIVENLFADVPVRFKYLKSEQTELGHILDVVTRMAAAAPHIHWQLFDGDKEKLNLTATDFELRTLAFFPDHKLADFISLNYKTDDLAITGLILKPNYNQKRSQKQYLSVNGRPLNVHFVTKALKEAMSGLMPHDVTPAYNLSLTIDPAAVDINVHPRKLEARFFYQQFLYQKLLRSTIDLLTSQVLTPDFKLVSTPAFTGGPAPYSSQAGSGFDYNLPSRNHGSVNAALAFGQSFSGHITSPSLAEVNQENLSGLTPLAQVANSYILALSEAGLEVIDQHAAHERIRYNLLKTAYEGREKGVQKLLVPFVQQLTALEKMKVAEYHEALKEIGFSLELSGDELLVDGVPQALYKEDIKLLITGLIADLLAEQVELNSLNERVERVLNFAACRSAIKFGQNLTKEEMVALLNQLAIAEKGTNCPHGRPTRICLSYSDLEKQFKR
ncbi:DNA mismatch repair endonuclease MutL [Candidatus Gracilibacteria bacterium]|nr:DNA mismatch repair endonuclease MutL [Candidatus Gracilibacteria bacterium]